MKGISSSQVFFRAGLQRNHCAKVQFSVNLTNPRLSFTPPSSLFVHSAPLSTKTEYVERELQVSATSSCTQESSFLQLGVSETEMWSQQQQSHQGRQDSYTRQDVAQPSMQGGGYVVYENGYAGRNQGRQTNGNSTYRMQANGYYGQQYGNQTYQRPQWNGSYSQIPQGNGGYGRGWNSQSSDGRRSQEGGSGQPSYHGRGTHGSYTQRSHGSSGYGRGWNSQPSDSRRWQESGPRQQVRQLDDSRHWLESSERGTPTGEKFVFLSYNILSSNNARDHYREMYYHIPMRFMKWEWRRSRLSQEIEFWSPDILCLQEVDRFDDLQDELKKKGYGGIYKARTGEATDGCAIFWREKRFMLLEEDSIEFRDLGLRDNVAQFCVLRSTSNFEAALNGETSGVQNNCVVVANTHLLFNPKRGDIKLGQVRTLLNTAYEMSQAWGGAEVVIGGDFNSTPSSPLYSFISTSELDVAPLERYLISGQIAAGEGQGYRRTWFSSWRRSSTQTSSLTNSAVNKQVEIVAERAANLLTLQETQTETAQAKEKLSNQLMVLKEESKQLMVVGEAESSGRWVREVKTEENECESSESQTLVETSDPSFTEGEEDTEVDSSVALSARHQQLQRILPCGWTVEEMLNATGSSECTKVSHHLNLQSAYPEIQGKTGSRDAKGEPQATTYHKKFLGTVDYIWHTTGLRPLKVLDTLPMNVLRQTGGLPTQKWASDHMALVCEMAFNQ